MRRIISILFILLIGIVFAGITGIHPAITIAAIMFGSMVLHRFNLIPKGALFMAFVDLLWTQGQDNMGGLVGEIFFCPAEDILTLPDLSAVGALDTEAAVDIACKTGKNFIRIYHTAETGKIDYNTVGDRDAKSKENILEWLYPGDDKTLAEVERLIQNTPGVYICKDTKGNLRLLGVSNLDASVATLTLDIPCYVETSNGTTGMARADRRGTTFQVKHSASHRPVFYMGTVPLTPAA